MIQQFQKRIYKVDNALELLDDSKFVKNEVEIIDLKIAKFNFERSYIVVPEKVLKEYKLVYKSNNTPSEILTLLQDLNNFVVKACKTIREKGNINERS